MAEEILPGLFPEYVVEFGRVGTKAKGWAKVKFKKPYPRAPIIIALGEYRKGWFTAPTYEAPTYSVEVPSVEVTAARVASIARAPSVGVTAARAFSVEIPRITRDDMRPIVQRDFYNACVERLGDWKVGILNINWARDRICSVFDFAGYITGGFMNYLWDRLIQPQIDRVQSTINSAISENLSRSNDSTENLKDSTQAGFNSLRDWINSAFRDDNVRTNDSIESLKDSTQAGFNRLRNSTEVSINRGLGWTSDQLTDAVNKSVEKFYEATGMDKGMLMTPPLVRNVTASGFDFYSLGPMTLHYFAISTGEL